MRNDKSASPSQDRIHADLRFALAVEAESLIEQKNADRRDPRANRNALRDAESSPHVADYSLVFASKRSMIHRSEHSTDFTDLFQLHGAGELNVSRIVPRTGIVLQLHRAASGSYQPDRARSRSPRAHSTTAGERHPSDDVLFPDPLEPPSVRRSVRRAKRNIPQNRNPGSRRNSHYRLNRASHFAIERERIVLIVG